MAVDASIARIVHNRLQDICNDIRILQQVLVSPEEFDEFLNAVYEPGFLTPDDLILAQLAKMLHRKTNITWPPVGEAADAQNDKNVAKVQMQIATMCKTVESLSLDPAGLNQLFYDVFKSHLWTSNYNHRAILARLMLQLIRSEFDLCVVPRQDRTSGYELRIPVSVMPGNPPMVDIDLFDDRSMHPVGRDEDYIDESLLSDKTVISDVNFGGIGMSSNFVPVSDDNSTNIIRNVVDAISHLAHLTNENQVITAKQELRKLGLPDLVIDQLLYATEYKLGVDSLRRRATQAELKSGHMLKEWPNQGTVSESESNIERLKTEELRIYFEDITDPIIEGYNRFRSAIPDIGAYDQTIIDCARQELSKHATKLPFPENKYFNLIVELLYDQAYTKRREASDGVNHIDRRIAELDLRFQDIIRVIRTSDRAFGGNNLQSTIPPSPVRKIVETINDSFAANTKYQIVLAVPLIKYLLGGLGVSEKTIGALTIVRQYSSGETCHIDVAGDPAVPNVLIGTIIPAPPGISGIVDQINHLFSPNDVLKFIKLLLDRMGLDNAVIGAIHIKTPGLEQKTISANHPQTLIENVPFTPEMDEQVQKSIDVLMAMVESTNTFGKLPFAQGKAVVEETIKRINALPDTVKNVLRQNVGGLTKILGPSSTAPSTVWQ